MKKLIAIPILSLGISSMAQISATINEKDLLGTGSVNTGSRRYVPQRIALKTGVELEYVEHGNPEGIPVIFLHGVTDSWHSFESTLPHLPEHIHAFALSQRGHGDSQRPTDGYTPTHFAADIAAFIEQKKLNQVVIAGHSMGGIVAQKFALDHPALTKAVVIIGSDPSFSRNEGMPEFYREVMDMKDHIDREYMIGFQKATLSKEIDSVYFNLLVDESMKVPVKVFQAAMTGLMNDDYADEVRKISQPTLIFWGSKDAFFLREGQEKMARSINGSKSIVYEGAGHALHWEQPQRFAKDIADFIHLWFIKSK